MQYSDPDYVGPAVKVGAGVQTFEACSFADKNSVRVVGGDCLTVGLAGGTRRVEVTTSLARSMDWLQTMFSDGNCDSRRPASNSIVNSEL